MNNPWDTFNREDEIPLEGVKLFDMELGDNFAKIDAHDHSPGAAFANIFARTVEELREDMIDSMRKALEDQIFEPRIMVMPASYYSFSLHAHPSVPWIPSEKDLDGWVPCDGREIEFEPLDGAVPEEDLTFEEKLSLAEGNILFSDQVDDLESCDYATSDFEERLWYAGDDIEGAARKTEYESDELMALLDCDMEDPS